MYNINTTLFCNVVGTLHYNDCHFMLWQRCWHVFFTTLLNQPFNNVVQRCIYVVCLLGGHQHFGCPLTINFLTKCGDPAAFQGETLKLWVESKVHCCVLKQCQSSVGLSVKFFSFFIVFFFRGFTGVLQARFSFHCSLVFSWGGGALRCCCCCCCCCCCFY